LWYRVRVARCCRLGAHVDAVARVTVDAVLLDLLLEGRQPPRHQVNVLHTDQPHRLLDSFYSISTACSSRAAATGIFVQGSKNSGGLGDRGTSTTLTKSLDQHDYNKCHRSTLGVRTQDPQPPATAPGVQPVIGQFQTEAENSCFHPIDNGESPTPPWCSCDYRVVIRGTLTYLPHEARRHRPMTLPRRFIHFLKLL